MKTNWLYLGLLSLVNVTHFANASMVYLQYSQGDSFITSSIDSCRSNTGANIERCEGDVQFSVRDFNQDVIQTGSVDFLSETNHQRGTIRHRSSVIEDLPSIGTYGYIYYEARLTGYMEIEEGTVLQFDWAVDGVYNNFLGLFQGAMALRGDSGGIWGNTGFNIQSDVLSPYPDPISGSFDETLSFSTPALGAGYYNINTQFVGSQTRGVIDFAQTGKLTVRVLSGGLRWITDDFLDDPAFTDNSPPMAVSAPNMLLSTILIFCIILVKRKASNRHLKMQVKSDCE